MASPIVCDVSIKRATKTTELCEESSTSDKENHGAIEIDKCSKTEHHSAERPSSSACRTTEPHCDSSKKRKFSPDNSISDISHNETINSSTSQKLAETFSSHNTSSSTNAASSLETPPNKLFTRPLSVSQQKRSPPHGAAWNKPSTGASIRSQKPTYTQRVLPVAEYTSPIPSRIFKEDTDPAVVETTSMNGERFVDNEPEGATSKLNLSGSSGNSVTDANRFSEAPRNWTVMTSANTEKREHLYKILVIGELGTGKTSFIKRYVHQFFSQNYRATIGVDFALKVLHWDPNTVVRLQLWDIAGQERFGNMTRVYYKEAVGAFIVFDVTRSGTFDCVSKWKEDLDSKVQLPDGSSIPCILLANKCDQDKQGIVTNNERMDEYVKEHGFAGWFETSAKENINIDEAARALVNKILLNDKLISAADLADSEKFNLNNTAEQTTADGRNKCSC